MQGFAGVNSSPAIGARAEFAEQASATAAAVSGKNQGSPIFPEPLLGGPSGKGYGMRGLLRLVSAQVCYSIQCFGLETDSSFKSLGPVGQRLGGCNPSYTLVYTDPPSQ